MCLKPSVTMSPTRAPRRSSTALVATVVPWRIASSSRELDLRLGDGELDALDDADRLVVRRAGRLCEPDALPVAVMEEDVGERPADVDPEAVGHVPSSLAGHHRPCVLRDPHVAASRVALEVLDPRLAGADLTDHDARRLVALLVRHGLEVLPDPEPAGVARGARRREDVVGADRLVAVGNRRRLPEEERAVVAHPLEVPARVGGLDLHVLERIGIRELERLVVRVDDHHHAVVLPGSRGDIRRRQVGELDRHLADRLLRDGAGGGDEHGGRRGTVLGLAEQVGSENRQDPPSRPRRSGSPSGRR